MASEATKQAQFEKSKQELVKLLTAAKDGDVAALAAAADELAVTSETDVAHVFTGYKDGAGRTCLHFAANFGQIEACQHILTVAPDTVDVADEEGCTPLFMAALGDKKEVVDLLLSKKADVNKPNLKGLTPVHVAARHDHFDALTSLVSARPDLTIESTTGTPLMTAAGEGSLRSVNLLLPMTPDLNAKSSSQNLTALLSAALGGYRKCLLAIAAAGADVSVQGPVGLTALHLVADRGDVEACSGLLDQESGRAAAGIKNDDNLLPVQLAAGNGHEEVVALLLPHSGLDGVSSEELIKKEKERVAQEAARAPMPSSAGGESSASAEEVPLPPEASDADKERALALKAEGNEMLKDKAYDRAIEKYTEAIKLDGRNHVFWSNRSAAFLALGRFEEAAADGAMVVRLNPTWPKGYFRQGQALMEMKRYEDAAVAFYAGVSHDETDELSTAFQRAIRLGRKAHLAAQKK